MKKGFALLETLIVISFLSVSLLMLYKTFAGMVNNSAKNILYDDATNIYKAFYLKEYLSLNNLSDLLNTDDIKEISCTDFTIASCNSLTKEMNINKIYVTKYDLKNYQTENYPSYFNNYIATLSNKDNFKYRFIIELKEEDTYSYASLPIGGEDDE